MNRKERLREHFQVSDRLMREGKLTPLSLEEINREVAEERERLMPSTPPLENEEQRAEQSKEQPKTS